MNENMNADMNMAAVAVEIRELHAFFVTYHFVLLITAVAEGA